MICSITYHSTALAKIYFVNTQIGNDAFSGQSQWIHGNQGPWKSLVKVNNTNFLPGDSILFHRGQVWKGTLEPRIGGEAHSTISIHERLLSTSLTFDLVDPDNNKCIYFGAYGHGEKPKLDCIGERGLVLRHNYIIVEELHLENGGNAMIRLDRPGGNYWTILRKIDLTNCSGNAVSFYQGGGNCWFDSLYIYNFAINGIYLRGSETNKLEGVLVENCWIKNPDIRETEDAISCHQDEQDHGIGGKIIIRSNHIVRSGEDGIDITSGQNILLEGNRVEESFNAGILVHYDRVRKVEIRGNFLASNVKGKKGDGEMRLGSSQIRVVNNILTGRGHHTILFDNASEIQFWNNTVAPDSSTGSFMLFINEGSHAIDFKNNIFDFSRTNQQIERVSGSTLYFDHNCYVTSSTFQQIFTGSSFEMLKILDSGFEPHGFVADPKFSNSHKSEPAHFKLQASSSCIDAGASIPLATDFWKTTRSVDDPMDIGVYEYDQ